jgi:parallel beta-helix repeat protein
MKNKIILKFFIIGIIFVLINTNIISGNKAQINTYPIGKNHSDILYVGGTGPGNYSNIHDAVDNASNGHTVYVYNGEYPGNIVIDKSIDLIGEDKFSTFIAGGINGIVIFSDNVKITQFTIKNIGGFYRFCIYAGSNENEIYDNIITDSDKVYGIYLDGASYNNIYQNYIENINRHGMRLDFSSNNEISKNIIRNNNGYGLLLSESSNNNIYENTVKQNNWDGINIGELSYNNLIFHNNLINNTLQNGVDESGNLWDNGYPSGGNFWSDYKGIDQFRGPNQDIPGVDGIGDTPYEIPYEHSTDFYPLMYPFGITNPPVIDGLTNGIPGIEYFYNFTAIDPSIKGVYFFIDWGDDSNSGWVGPTTTPVTLGHTWSEKGTFTIKAKIKDSNGESEWATLIVTIPRSKFFNIPMLLYLENCLFLFKFLK